MILLISYSIFQINKTYWAIYIIYTFTYYTWCIYNPNTLCICYLGQDNHKTMYKHGSKMPSFLSVGLYVHFIILFVTYVSLKIETLNLTQVCILVCITRCLSLIIPIKPVSRLRPFKKFCISIGIWYWTSKILNDRHLETGLVRIMKLIPVVIHTMTHTCVKFKV
jgi:hypothetical protein